MRPDSFRLPRFFASFPAAWICGLLLTVCALSAEPPVQNAPSAASAREHILIDPGWRFAFGHPSDPARDFDHGTGYFSYFAKAGFGDGPAGAGFNDSAWRQLDLPHDWAVELPFSPNASHSHGNKSVGRNFPESSVGWYRKTFTIPASDLGRRVSIEFEGVFRDSVVWINGFYLGRQPSGYTGFRYDLTDYLNYGGENVIAVRVDATMEEGWFYEGAGIYRHVWLTKTAPVHVAPWGVFVSTELEGDNALVATHAKIANEGTSEAKLEVEQSVVDASGRVVASGPPLAATLPAGGSVELAGALTVAHPQLWSLESPVLHKLVTVVRSAGAEIDRCETVFGVRTIRFDPDHGFFLNGKRVELQGVNNHQDHAGVGVALPDALQEFRIRHLKELGVNAWRCAHNPPSPAFLDACDRLGMLVLDENRGMGMGPEQRGQLEAMILRDRNHPSVILWSLGNEEWAIEGNIKGARLAATMQAFARQLDPTRRSTVAISGGWGGISTVIDVVGYNYINQSNPDNQHAKFPLQPGVGTEETTTQGTRGIYFDDRPKAHLSPQEKGDTGGNCEKGWKYYAARPFLAGIFFWTGFDYRGEPTPFDWPAVSSQFGLLDSCGFPKDSSYYLKSWWTDQPVLHVFPHWNWAGREGQEINVWCYSNHEEVELLLNGRSLGKKEMPRNGHLEWKVPYQPGALEARGYRGGKVVESTRIETTGVAAKLVLTPDRTRLTAVGADVTVFAVSAVDANGRVVPLADNLVTFETTGGKIIGVGNGDPSSHEPDRFIDAVSQLTVDDWHGRIAAPGTVTPSAPESQIPLPRLANWLAPLPKPGEVYDLSATFVLTASPAGARLRLCLPALGSKTSVWLNGHELGRDLEPSALALTLDQAQLKPGANLVQLIVTPFGEGKSRLPELTRLGAVQILVPAAPWQRHLFNGYAEVIVQAGTQPGDIRLTAHSENLESAMATVEAR